jgi:hypothetical protein
LIFPGFTVSQGFVEHILVDISRIMVGNYMKRKEKLCLMKRWAKLPKGKGKKNKKEEEKEKGKE